MEGKWEGADHPSVDVDLVDMDGCSYEEADPCIEGAGRAVGLDAYAYSPEVASDRMGHAS